MLIRPVGDDSYVRALDGDGNRAWRFDAPSPIWRWLATPFALLLQWAVAAIPGPPDRVELATLLPDGRLGGPPQTLGGRDTNIDLLACDGARLLWIGPAGRRLACAPLAEPQAIIWEADIPDDVYGYDRFTKGVDRGQPPAMVTEAGVVVAFRKRVVLLA
jgi:hypothetical protein